MLITLLTIFVALMPFISIVLELIVHFDIEERHHTHHDTYVVPGVVTRTLMLVVGFMGMLGALVSWLCRVGIFGAVNHLAVLGFFVSFEAVLFVLQMAVGRYQVVTYVDRLTVRPLVGPTRTIYYQDIVSMVWRPRYPGSRVRDLRIWSQDGVTVRLWGLLDIDQMLVRIDRFDAIAD